MPSTTPTLVTGDDFTANVTLYVDGATFDASGATITAAVVSRHHATKFTSDVAQSEVATGADWANSLIVVEFGPTETAKVTEYGSALVEIQVNDGTTKRSWFQSVVVVKGQVA